MVNTILYFAFAVVVAVNGCPYQHMVQHCTCTDTPVAKEYNITCAGLTDDTQLLLNSEDETDSITVNSFTLENSVISFIPSTAFNGTKLRNFIIKDSSFNALTEKDVAFVGLEKSLEKIMVSNCNILKEWNWSIFRELKKLKRVHITDGNMEKIEKIESLKHLKLLNLRNNSIHRIDDKAFEKMVFLVNLNLDNNEISFLKTSMFPANASIMSLSLRYNNIVRLPRDMFTNMPMLKELDISFNKMFTLDRKLLEPIWMDLQSFKAEGNQLICDCRLKWITKTSKFIDSSAVEASCYLPQRLRDRRILTLQNNELRC